MRIHKLSSVAAAAVILIFVAVCAYMGAEIYDKISTEYETQPIKFISLRQSIELDGIVIRREQLVCSPFPEDEPAVGERLPAGKIVAVNGEGEPFCLSESSFFYKDTDGFEYLRPEDTAYLSTGNLRELLNSPGQKEKAYGKFVSGWDWYYAALSSASSAPDLYSECELLFPGKASALTGRVIYISPDENGEQIVLLRLNSGAEEYMHLRKTAAELVISDYSGFQVPMKALQSDSEGNKFVYTLTAGKEVSTAVEIIYKDGDSCLIKSAEPEKELRDGLRLIISRKTKTREGLSK